MAQIEIPKRWREQVSAILATERTGGLIRWTGDAEMRYEIGAASAKLRWGDNSPVWKNEIYAPIRNYLCSVQPMGCLVFMDYPSGQTYEFFFPYLGQTFYAKILLYPDGKRVLVLSAHLADSNRLSCE